MTPASKPTPQVLEGSIRTRVLRSELDQITGIWQPRQRRPVDIFDDTVEGLV